MAIYGMFNITNKKLRICLLLICALALLMWFSTAALYIVLKVFPEIGLVTNSQCNYPLQNWDGKVMNVPIWTNAFAGRNLSFSVHNNVTSYDRRRLSLRRSNAVRDHMQPVVLWGSHHKTGTYLAQKMFSLLCSRMGWCCIFHVTRDSVEAIQHSLSSEPVKVLGHSQWLWYPEELGVPYRFVHFYRQPFKKIVSGYRYHQEGAEAWTRVPKPYASSCTSELSVMASLMPSRHSVVQHCKSVQLCETCCRREHEVRSNEMRGKTDRLYTIREQPEYDFVCRHLGRVNGSLQDSLLSLAPEEGILTEAALDFYENLRMARIVNHTWNDPHSLNVDLDNLMTNYASVTRQILRHLDLGLPPKELELIAKEMSFFDLSSSPIYRWSMSNPFVNHVNKQRDKGTMDFMTFLKSSTEIMQVYKETIELMAVSTSPDL